MQKKPPGAICPAVFVWRVHGLASSGLGAIPEIDPRLLSHTERTLIENHERTAGAAE
jgi:hypothetical protein